jgi:phosphoinositide-3-kinase regulatory subunit
VVDLINHYKEVSLAEYNNSLDVKLLFPISRYEKGDEDEDKDKILSVLGEVSQDYLVKSRYFELHSNLQTQTLDEIHLKKQAIEAFDYAIGFFEEQIQVHRQLQAQAPTNTDARTTKELEDNYAYLSKRLANMQDSRTQLVDSLTLQRAYSRIVEAEIITLKPQLTHLRKQRSRLVKKLEVSGVDYEAALSPGIADMWDDSLWYKADASRQDAAYYLKDKPDGTFLVRKSATGELALSLILGGVGHCIIYQGAVGFGFTKYTAYFPSPRALILYYSAHSLEEFNSHLKTCLKYPAFGPIPQINS